MDNSLTYHLTSKYLFHLRFGLKQHYAVKIVAAYVMVTWVVMDICYFGV